MKEVSPEQREMLSAKIMDACNICKGRRYLEDGPCVCRRKYEIAIKQLEANIPENFKKMTIINTVDDEFKNGNANSFGKILWYSNKLGEALQDGGSLYLYGPEGAGVSFLGVSILMKAIEDDFSAYFILAGEFWRLASGALTDDELRVRISDMMTTTDFLLIDDIDQMFINRAESPLVTLLYSLLKMRFYANKPVIFTASINKSELDASVGRFVSIYDEKIAEIEFDANHKPKLRDNWARKFFNGNK